jgi:hypothetical protein
MLIGCDMTIPSSKYEVKNGKIINFENANRV